MLFRNLKYCSSLIICVFLLLSCNKGEITYEFEGKVSGSVNGSSLAGVNVTISQVLFSSSVANYNYQLAGSAVTDAAGDWAISFTREKVTDFRIAIQKDGYFKELIEFTSGEATVADPNVHNVTLDAEAWIKFDIKNVGPLPSDVMTMVLINFREGCVGCGTNGNYSFDGIVDTNIIYKTTGGRYTRFQFNNQTTSSLLDDSLLTIPSDTVYYTYYY
ncbi:carboxypeptidase regulatory-like domain-containing protein [bacterium AH-315-C20]|nr:carboxypeptidase regulatory-like domain-containing protein [bacterium AH-315-C20]